MASDKAGIRSEGARSGTMRQAAAFFSSEDGKRIEQAVKDAESRTAAEFVPAAASASSHYDSAEDIIGVLAGAVAAGVSWLVFDVLTAELWGGAPWWSGALAGGLAALLGFLAGAALGSALPGLRLAFTTSRAKRAAVEARARQIFDACGVYSTTGGAGVLLYASMLEGMAAVVADRRVEEVFGPAGMDDVRSILEKGLKAGTPCESMRLAIAAAGAKLSGPFPRHDDDVNELPDALVLVDEL